MTINIDIDTVVLAMDLLTCSVVKYKLIIVL